MFPDFDDNTRKAFRRETEMFFGYIMRENRSALELLSADYTFLNERLAKHYGIPGVYGERFRQVKLTDPNRRGLLGQGSILSLTAVATRTSPVFRGKFILTTFLDTPPIAAAAGRADARGKQQGGAATKPKTVREQLEAHRANAAVRVAAIASSIRRASRSRTSIRSGSGAIGTPIGAPIDTAGVLADGTKVDGPVALREAILSRPDAFVTTLTERLLTYALGRGLEPSDMPVVRRIVKKAAQNDYRFASIISGIVESAPFQMRTQAGAGRTDQHGRTSEGTVAMIITKKHLSRRTFIRGTFGAAMALPLLDAMVPALTAQSRTAAGAPFRFGAIYMPNGVFPDTWHPTEVGSDFAVQAGDAAARAVPRSAGHGQQDEGAVGRVGAPRAPAPRSSTASGPVAQPRGHERRLREDPVEEDRRSVHRRQGGRRYAAALDRGRHRGHGHRGRAPATASRAPSSTRSPGATTRARCRSASTRASPSSGCSARPARRSSAPRA